MSVLTSKLASNTLLTAAEVATLQEAQDALTAAWADLQGDSFEIPISLFHKHIGEIPVSMADALPVYTAMQNWISGKLTQLSPPATPEIPG